MKKKPSTPAPLTPALATAAHEGTPAYGDYGHQHAAPAPLPPDHRAEGGNVYDLTKEQTAL
ncbi:hypothetical protein E4631_21145 [Hymenobacter sp. UV11]|uniref:hypothetical protein n=1 Tax=Hymenobacter sp. UV11 TaxID=1849735 RepID=UPI0010611720|nr:hypothetical protein [Hymenobacter sp. UV11]TDN38810.1 hypothetical protein A8B98_21840 [Hymenobacter sp. UV11]TFZ63801.1 hypothetical protein E4631_21145 [Hymenobacter sp. UV11]